MIAVDLGVDLQSRSGELMADVLAAFANYERRLIGQRTADALAVLKAQGVQLGRPAEVPVSVDERVVQARQSGMTTTAIAATLNEDDVPTAHGGQRWWPTTISAVLRSQSASAFRDV